MAPVERRGRAALWLGGLLVAGLCLAVLAAPWLAPRDPLAVDLGQRLLPPGGEFPLGSDQLGRCQLSRLLHGGRASLLLGLLAAGLAAGAGTLGGVAAGLAGGRVAWWLSRVVDVALAFPGLLLALVLVGTVGAGPGVLVAALGLVGWGWWARLVAGMVQKARSREHVLGAVAAGLPPGRILLGYVLPSSGPAWWWPWPRRAAWPSPPSRAWATWGWPCRRPPRSGARCSTSPASI